MKESGLLPSAWASKNLLCQLRIREADTARDNRHGSVRIWCDEESPLVSGQKNPEQGNKSRQTSKQCPRRRFSFSASLHRSNLP
jgi:hypothetical protein